MRITSRSEYILLVLWCLLLLLDNFLVWFRAQQTLEWHRKYLPWTVDEPPNDRETLEWWRLNIVIGDVLTAMFIWVVFS